MGRKKCLGYCEKVRMSLVHNKAGLRFIPKVVKTFLHRPEGPSGQKPSGLKSPGPLGLPAHRPAGPQGLQTTVLKDHQRSLSEKKSAKV